MKHRYAPIALSCKAVVNTITCFFFFIFEELPMPDGPQKAHEIHMQLSNIQKSTVTQD